MNELRCKPAHLCALTLVVAVAAYTDSAVGRPPADFILAGGASVIAAPLNSLRSGNPGQRSTASFFTPLTPGASLQGVEFDYQYDTGFGSAGAGLGSNFTLSFAGSVLYRSPHLTDYAYAENRTNYSTPIAVRATGLSVVVRPRPSALRHNVTGLRWLCPLCYSLCR